MRLSDREFKLIGDLVYRLVGIKLAAEKKTLVIERLQKIIRNGGFRSFHEYYEHVLADESGREIITLVDRISTNHTFFFREQHHFDFMRQRWLPEMLAEGERSGQRELRIWSAGCSSGEEPYSIAMLLADQMQVQQRGWNVKILATDIAVSVLEKAVAGIYDDAALEGISEAGRRKHFQRLPDGKWQVRPQLQEMILFRRLNLINESYPFRNQFHLIFCRNVMIYFDERTRAGILQRFHRHLANDGYLFIGHSETANQHSALFTNVQPAIYRKVGEQHETDTRFGRR